MDQLIPTISIPGLEAEGRAVQALFLIGGAALYVAVALFASTLAAWAGLRAVTASSGSASNGELEDVAVRSLVSPIFFAVAAALTAIVRYVLAFVTAVIRFFTQNRLLLVILILILPLELVIDSYHPQIFQGLHILWTCFLTPIARTLVLPYSNLLGFIIDSILPFVLLIGRLIRRLPFIVVFTLLGCTEETLRLLASALGVLAQTFAVDLGSFLTSGNILTNPLDVFQTGVAIERVVFSTKNALTCLCALTASISCPFYDQFGNSSASNFACAFNASVAGTASIWQNTYRPVFIGLPSVISELVSTGELSPATAELLRPSYNTTFDAFNTAFECQACLIDDVGGAYYVGLVTFVWDLIPTITVFPPGTEPDGITVPNIENPTGSSGPMPIPKVVSCLFDIVQILIEAAKFQFNFLFNVDSIFNIPDGQLLFRPDDVYTQYQVFIDCVCYIVEYIANLVRFFGIEYLNFQFDLIPGTIKTPATCGLDSTSGCFLPGTGAPGCRDFLCCSNVCTNPSFEFCCVSGWNQTCADQAAFIDCQAPRNAFQAIAVGLTAFEAILDYVCCLVRTLTALLLRLVKNIAEIFIGSLYTSAIASPSSNSSACLAADNVTYLTTFECTVPLGSDIVPILRFAKFYWGDRRNASGLTPNVAVNEFAVTGQIIVDFFQCTGDLADRLVLPLQCVSCAISRFAQWIVDLGLLAIDVTVHVDQIVANFDYVLNLQLNAPVQSFDAFIECAVGGLRKLSPDECVPTNLPMPSTTFTCCLADLIESAAAIIQESVRFGIQLIRNLVLVLDAQPPEVPFKTLLTNYTASLQEFVDITYDIFCLLFNVIVPNSAICPGSLTLQIKSVLLRIVAAVARIVVSFFETILRFIIAFMCTDPMAPNIKPFVEALILPFSNAFIELLRSLADAATCVGIPELATLLNDIATALQNVLNVIVDVLVEIVQFVVTFFSALVQCVASGNIASQACIDLATLFAEFVDAILTIVFGNDPRIIACFIQNQACLFGDDGTLFGLSPTECASLGSPLVLCACDAGSDPLCNLQNALCSIFPFKIEVVSPCNGDSCNLCDNAPTFLQFLESFLCPILQVIQDAACIIIDLNLDAFSFCPITPCTSTIPLLCVSDVLLCAFIPGYDRVVKDGTCCFYLPASACAVECNSVCNCGVAPCPCTSPQCQCNAVPECACGGPGSPNGCSCADFPGIPSPGCGTCSKKRDDDSDDLGAAMISAPTHADTNTPWLPTVSSDYSMHVGQLVHEFPTSAVGTDHCRSILSRYPSTADLSQLVIQTMDADLAHCVLGLSTAHTLKSSKRVPEEFPDAFFVSLDVAVNYLTDVAHGFALLRNSNQLLSTANASSVTDALRLVGVKYADSALALREWVEYSRNRLSSMHFQPVSTQNGVWNIWQNARRAKRQFTPNNQVAMFGFERSSGKTYSLVKFAVDVSAALLKFGRNARLSSWYDATRAVKRIASQVSMPAFKQYDSSLGAEFLPSFRSFPVTVAKNLVARFRVFESAQREKITQVEQSTPQMREYQRAIIMIQNRFGVSTQALNDSLIEMFQCDPNAQSCTNCSVIDQIINETAQWADGAVCFYQEVYSNQTLPAYILANELLYNPPENTDTFATSPKTVPFVLDRLATVNWPWTWDLAAFLQSIGVDPGTIEPPADDSPNSVVTIQVENQDLVGRPDVQLVWLSFLSELGLDLTRAASGVTQAIVSSVEVLVTIFETYIGCAQPSYNEALWCKNDVGFGLFDGLVLATLIVAVVGLFLCILAPCGTCLSALFVVSAFFPLVFLFGYRSGLSCSVPVDIGIPFVATVALPLAPACIGRDAFELLNEAVSPCAPIPQQLIDLSSPQANQLCSLCTSEPPVLRCAQAAGFIDGFDNLFFIIGSLSPSLLDLLISSGLLNIYPPLMDAAVRYTPEMLAQNPAALTCFLVLFLNIVSAVLFLSVLSFIAVTGVLAAIAPYLVFFGLFVLLAFAEVELLYWLQVSFVQRFGVQRESLKLKTE